MTIPSDWDLADRVGAAVARVPEWQGRTMRFSLAAAPVASPTHRAVASDCVQMRLAGEGESDGGETVFLKVRHPDMAADLGPAMPEATRRAGRLGLGPVVLAEAQGVLGLEDLSGTWRTARVGDLQDPAIMGQVLGTLRRLHAAEPLGREFCPFARIAMLAEEARARAAPLPEDIERLLASANLIRDAIRAAGVDRAFCRNDGTASNLMLNLGPRGIAPDGVRLLDFDLAGDNDPWFEIGALLNEAYVFDDERRQAVEIYAGSYDERLFHRARLYGAVDDLMWGLWGITRAITSRRPGIEFFKYGQWRLLHARTACATRDFERWLRRL